MEEKWEVHETINAPKGCFEITVKGTIPALRVASVDGWDAKANAKLIAAAPELLEALKALVVAPVDNVDHFLRAVKDAEQAIAKATKAACKTCDGKGFIYISKNKQASTPCPDCAKATA